MKKREKGFLFEGIIKVILISKNNELLSYKNESRIESVHKQEMDGTKQLFFNYFFHTNARVL